MSKYKVCVYTICKNEEKFVDRWYNSMKEADKIYVLDTGSSDNTVKLLKQKGVIVKTKIINPWRFDVARNESLAMIDEKFDIYVCTDLDEVFNKGWRKKLENIWKKDTNKCKYIYNWSLNDKHKPIVSFYYEKIHDKNYKWIYPVHEVLKFTSFEEKHVETDKIILNHYPDNLKSRSSYLNLLELSVKENPNNDRNMHYLGREYMYYGKWNECIDTLIKHLGLKSSTWRDERCASMRFIARSYINLNRIEEARMWLDKAIDEAPYLRDSYVERALLEYSLNNFSDVKKYCLLALEIENHEKTYINETFSWDDTIYDLLSLAYYDEGNYEEALKNINIALCMTDFDERLLKNLELIETKLKEK